MQKIVIKTSIVVSLAVASTYAAAQGVITGLEVKKNGSGIEIWVKGTGLKAPSVARVWQGKSFLASFSADMKCKPYKVNIGQAGLEFAQITQFSKTPPVTRIHLRLRPEDVPVVRSFADGYILAVNVDQLSVETGPNRETPVPVTAPSTKPRPANNGLTRLPNPSNNPKPTPKPTPNPTANPTAKPVDKPASAVTTISADRAVLSSTVDFTSNKIVSLDFVETDVVLVLKALAAQARINIITSPDVKGSLTLTLDKVSVDDALNFVTALSGLRYQKVGRTVIVAPPDKILGIMAGVNASAPQLNAAVDTRIVPLYSRQGRQVRSAIYRVLNQDSRDGRYEIGLPSENTFAVNAPQPTATDGAVIDPKGAAASSTTADDYVMIIGSTRRLDEIEKAVRSLDEQICRATGIDVPTTSGTISETYFVKGASASSLANALGVKENKVGGATVVFTPITSNARQTLVLTGRETEVKRIMKTLAELDGAEIADEEFFVYDVKSADPRSLRDELMSQIPGIRATIPPAGVGNTRLYVPTSLSSSASSNGNSTSESSSSSTEKTKGDTGSVALSDGLKNGLSLPFANMEPVAVPMRIVIRGQAGNIEKATKLLGLLDTQPRQIALELRVMELAKEDALNAGLDWNLFTGGAVKFIRLNNSLAGGKNSAGVSINDKNFSGDVVGTLDKIATKNNLIAKPNMVAYDGRQSEIFIGDVIRYVESVTSSQNGPTVQIGEVRVGVNLAVLARIAADNTATLDLRPTVSFLRGFNKVSVSGFSADLPQTSERISQQTVSVVDGQTIAIGGLMQEQEVRDVSGIPILMDLPILGNFFKSSRTTKTRKELVIFITTKSIEGALGKDNNPLPAIQGNPNK